MNKGIILLLMAVSLLLSCTGTREVVLYKTQGFIDENTFRITLVCYAPESKDRQQVIRTAERFMARRMLEEVRSQYMGIDPVPSERAIEKGLTAIWPDIIKDARIVKEIADPDGSLIYVYEVSQPGLKQKVLGLDFEWE